MKKFKILLVFSLLVLASCSKPDESKAPGQCHCTKIYYLYYPSMGNGASYIPAHYNVVDTQIGDFNCSDASTNYVPVSSAHYTHYKINCD